LSGIIHSRAKPKAKLASRAAVAVATPIRVRRRWMFLRTSCCRV